MKCCEFCKSSAFYLYHFFEILSNLKIPQQVYNAEPYHIFDYILFKIFIIKGQNQRILGKLRNV